MKDYRVGLGRRLVNAVVEFLVGRGRGPANTFNLTTLGRVTGGPHTTPVTLIVRDGVRYLVAPYGRVDWVKNLEQRPVATLERGPAVVQVAAHRLGPEEAAPILAEYLRRLHTVVGSFFEVEPDASFEEFVAIADRHPVFRLDEA